jgi:hypothetical protein
MENSVPFYPVWKKSIINYWFLWISDKICACCEKKMCCVLHLNIYVYCLDVIVLLGALFHLSFQWCIYYYGFLQITLESFYISVINLWWCEPPFIASYRLGSSGFHVTRRGLCIIYYPFAVKSVTDSGQAINTTTCTLNEILTLGVWCCAVWPMCNGRAVTYKPRD